MILVANETRLKTIFFEILFDLYWIFNLGEINPENRSKNTGSGFNSFQCLILENHNSLSRTSFLVFLELMASFLSSLSDKNSDNCPKIHFDN